MNTDEYANLERVERDHWYYVGKRALVQAWIARVRPLRSDHVLLDCGAGTGRFAAELDARCRVLVLDDHEAALQLLRARFRADQVLRLEDGRIPLPDGFLDCVTALDVLEHVPDDRAVVRDFHRVLKPGGLVVITVPAGMALWSDWDEVLHHFRRYDRQGLVALFDDGQWELLHVNHTNVVLYPAVWLVRRWRRWFPAPPGAARAEDRVPHPILNGILQAVFVRTGLARVPWPFGVSLILIARRRA